MKTLHVLFQFIRSVSGRQFFMKSEESPGQTGPLETFRLSPVSLAHDSHQNSNFLFRLRQLRRNCGSLIEYLVPVLELTTIFRALHGFISNVDNSGADGGGPNCF
jgi:hypothetical protein